MWPTWNGKWSDITYTTSRHPACQYTICSAGSAPVAGVSTCSSCSAGL